MALSFTPGQVVSWDDFNKMLAQHGSPNGAKSVVTLERKLTKEQREAIEDAGGDPNVDKNPTRRYYFEDGSYIDAQMDENASTEEWTAGKAPLRIVDYKPSAAFTQKPENKPATAGATTGRQAAEDERESIWNQTDPRGSGRYETHRAREAREEKDRKEADAAAKTDDTTVVSVEYTGTGKNRQKVTTYKSGRKVSEAAPQQATPTATTYETRNGKPVKVTKHDDGTETVEEQKPTVGQVVKGGGPNGEDVQAVADPATGQISYQPIKGAVNPNTPAPADLPKPSFRLEDVAKDLSDTQERLNEEVRAGRMTTARADAILKERRELWNTAIKQQEAIVNAQSTAHGQAITQRGQTLQDQGSRRSSATTIANQASSEWMPLATKLGAGANGYALLGAIEHSRRSAQNFVNSTAANAAVPEVAPGPALAAVNGMGTPGSVGMPQTPPFLAGRENALGVGGIGNQVAPQPIAGATPAVSAAAQGMPAPVFRPQPPAAYPLPDAMSSPAAVQAPSTFLSQARPGGIPQAPAPQYDPTPTIQAMIADPSWDNESVRAAVAEMYPGVNIEALLGPRVA